MSQILVWTEVVSVNDIQKNIVQCFNSVVILILLHVLPVGIKDHLQKLKNRLQSVHNSTVGFILNVSPRTSVRVQNLKKHNFLNIRSRASHLRLRIMVLTYFTMNAQKKSQLLYKIATVQDQVNSYMAVSHG